MLFIYYLSDGEIFNVGIGWNSLEEYYGYRAKEMSKIFGAVLLPYDKYAYDHHYLFKVNIKTKELEFKGEVPSYIQSLINKK